MRLGGAYLYPALVFAAAVQVHNIALALWGVAMSAVSVFYYLRVAILMFERPRSGAPQYDWPRTSVAGTTVLALTAAGTLVLGVFVALLLNVVTMVQAGMLPRL